MFFDVPHPTLVFFALFFKVPHHVLMFIFVNQACLCFNCPNVGYVVS